MMIKEKHKCYKILVLLKSIRDTNLWKKGQKQWLIFGTGACAGYVIGKYRGSGRWIKGWVHWEDEAGSGKAFKGGKADTMWIGKVEVSYWFYEYLCKINGSDI